MVTAAADQMASGSRLACEMAQNLYREYRTGLLTQLASGTGGDPRAAGDIFQETMLRAWQHASKIDSRRGSVRGWLGSRGTEFRHRCVSRTAGAPG
jgi:DNA-directed RNA polymerase specialized sigma24 family protein